MNHLEPDALPTQRQRVVMSDGGSGVLYQLVIEQLTLLRQEQRNGFDSMRAEFNGRIDRLVTQEAFAAEQQRTNDKFHDADKKVEAAERRLEKFGANLRWLAAAIVLPILLFGGNILYMSQTGGG